MMVDVVFVVVFARGDQPEIRVGLFGRKKPNFARGVAGDVQQNKHTAARAFDIDAKTLVALFIEQSVWRRAAEHMPMEPVRALRDFVFDGVKERAIVGGPGRAGDALDLKRKRFAAQQILDLQRVLAESGGIQRIGQQGIVVAHRKAAQA